MPNDNQNQKRPSWDEYFMMAAKLVSTMATCPRLRVGAVVVKNRRIIASGFNGAPPGQPHCTEVGCLKFEDEGSSCKRVIHAEHNAILQDSTNARGGTLYTVYIPCIDCMKTIVSSGISEVVYEVDADHKSRYMAAKDLAGTSGIMLRQIPEVKILDVLGNYYGGQDKVQQAKYANEEDKGEVYLEF